MSETATDRIAALCADLTNYERDRPDRVRFGLESMRRLLERPGAPEPPPRLVQVGGSKGKGTTSRYLAALAPPAARTGVYMSPHVETVLERVVLDGENVSESLLTQELTAVLDHARTGGITTSFFEVMTAASLGCFDRYGVEFGVLEVGLGGRLDATTAVPVDASILTSVELEHTELLGDTVEAIAAEKAHVFRPGGIGFTAVDGGALEVAERHAAEVGCHLEVFGRDFGAGEPSFDGSDLVASLWHRDGERAEVRIDGAPAYEVRAVALAWACLRTLYAGYALPARIARPRSPACFEVFDGPIVLDGAHTPASTALLADEMRRRFGAQRVDVLFAIARGKRWRECLEVLIPIADSFVVTEIAGTACESSDELGEWLEARGASVRIAVDAADGLRLLEPGRRGPSVVTGSFYLAGEVRSRLARHP